jgi:hypothetical protein
MRERAERTERRRKNTGVTGQRLGVVESMLDREKYAYRWLNDNPGRLMNKTKEDDWDIVFNDGVKEDSTDLGNAVRQVVGTHKDGSPLYAYLCRKPKTYFDEDQSSKHRDLDRQLEEMRRGNDRDGNQQTDYIPRTGISFKDEVGGR